MSEGLGPIGLPRTPAERRFWLLSEALRSVPLDQALELARRAEVFITGAKPGDKRDRSPSHSLNGAPEQPAIEAGASLGTHVERRAAEVAPRLALSAAQRDRLLNRLAEGAQNAELASEFGLSAKQVQGIRMGSSREIAKRRHGSTDGIPFEVQETALAEDVVRYLRQQDDTVVPEGSNAFLVNGRFRLTPNELVERANKMRRRRGKPEFRLRIPDPGPTVVHAISRPGVW